MSKANGNKRWMVKDYWAGTEYRPTNGPDYQVRQVVISSRGYDTLPEPAVHILAWNENGKAGPDGSVYKRAVSAFGPEDLMALNEAMTTGDLLTALDTALTAHTAVSKGGKAKVKAGAATASGDVDGAVALLDAGLAVADVIKSGFAGPTAAAALKIVKARTAAVGAVTVQP